MSNDKTYQHWRLETDNDNILWAYFDKRNAKVNTLDQETMEELSNIVDSLANDRTKIKIKFIYFNNFFQNRVEIT